MLMADYNDDQALESTPEQNLVKLHAGLAEQFSTTNYVKALPIVKSMLKEQGARPSSREALTTVARALVMKTLKLNLSAQVVTEHRKHFVRAVKHVMVEAVGSIPPEQIAMMEAAREGCSAFDFRILPSKARGARAP